MAETELETLKRENAILTLELRRMLDGFSAYQKVKDEVAGNLLNLRRANIEKRLFGSQKDKHSEK